jgi:L-fucose/D-arabinose isomerase
MVKTVGLISTMSPDKTFAQPIVERVAATHAVVKKALEGMGFRVLDEGPLHRTYDEMMAAGRSLRARGVQALVIYVGTWTYSNCSAAAATEAGVPVVIWGDAIPGTAGLVGSTIARGAMAEYGVHAHLVYGLFDDPATCQRVQSLLTAYCAATGLRGQVLGYAGGRTLGMVTAVCDPAVVRQKFGLEIDTFEQMELVERAEAIDEARVQPFFAWMQETFGEIVAKPDAVHKQIRLYFACRDLAEERGYDMLAVRCLPEMAHLYTSFCLAHAVLGDAEDAAGPKERYVFSCEADLNAAFTMQILKQLQDGPVLFADLTEFDTRANLISACNCGSHPTDFAKTKKDVRWEREGVHEFKWRYGGCCPQAVAHAGRATVARLSRASGEYEMLIAPVEVVEMPREKLRETVWERPHAYLKLLCDPAAFIDSVRSNHIHLVYGEWEAQLREVCAVLGVKVVEVR